MEDLVFTHINERARRLMGISGDEYRLCSYVDTWAGYPGSATPGWCNRTLPQKAFFIGITERGVTKMQNKMIEVGLLEKKDSTPLLRVTKAWFHAIHEAKEQRATATRLRSGKGNQEQSSGPDQEQSSGVPGNKVLGSQEQSSGVPGNEVPPHNKGLLISGNESGIKVFDDVETVTPFETVISFLNRLTGSEFRFDSAKTKEVINGRLKEKFTVEDLLLVVEHKTVQWGHDVKMKEYLRPITLFGKEKFEGYLQSAKTWVTNGKPQIQNFKNGQFTGTNNTNFGGSTDKSTSGAFN